MKLACIAIDDEPLALDIIVEYCNKISFLELVKTFDNAIDVLEFLKKEQVDLMFLDIQMEGLTGVQLLKVLNNRPKVVMTTAYEKFALQGYELDVTDYLLKPISFERFTKAVNKVYEIIFMEKGSDNRQKVASVGDQKITSGEDYIFVKADSKLVKVSFNEILYVEGQGDYLAIVTREKKLMTLQNFANLQQSLPYPDFVRVHKSYIIAFDKIDKIEKNRVYIGDKPIPVSDTYRNEFLKLIKKKEV